MAWNTLTYACGHSEDKQLYGKHAERERVVAAAESHDCPACRAASAKTADAESGLPILIGSDKQIAWAATIRDKIFAQIPSFSEKLADYQRKLDAGDIPGNATAEQVTKVRAELTANTLAISKLQAITKAGWFIDHRGATINTIISELMAHQ